MSDAPDFKHLLRRTAAALGVCALLVTLCYFFVDRPFAYFAFDRQFARHAFWKWLTYPPPLLQDWAPVALVALMIRRAWGPFCRWESTLLAAGIALILADQFRETLSFVFGRYWPETWIDNNPSLIGSGAYGFHPFHGGEAYGSFPSGHMARTLAAAVVVWIAHPRLRWACALACLAVAAGLLAMNYHFVGDVVAGSFVGGVAGMYLAHAVGLGAINGLTIHQPR